MSATNRAPAPAGRDELVRDAREAIRREPDPRIRAMLECLLDRIQPAAKGRATPTAA